MLFCSFTMVFVFGIWQVPWSVEKYSLRQFWRRLWFLNMTWAFAVSINYFRREKLVCILVVRVEYDRFNRVCIRKTGRSGLPKQSPRGWQFFYMGARPPCHPRWRRRWPCELRRLILDTIENAYAATAHPPNHVRVSKTIRPTFLEYPPEICLFTMQLLLLYDDGNST